MSTTALSVNEQATEKITSSTQGILACLALTMLLASLGAGSANVSLPTLVHSFNASLAQVQWVVLAYLLALTTLIVSVGRLADLYGRRRLLLTGLVVFTTASVLCGSATTLEFLIAARALQGLGGAIMMALTMALVGESMPKSKTGSAMGLLATMSAMGTALGPSVGGFLIATVGWQSIFLVNVPLALVALFLAWRYLPADQHTNKPANFDYIGTIVLALTLGAYALAMTHGQQLFSAASVGLLVLAGLGLGVFIAVESKIASPLISVTIFRHAGLKASLIMNALVSTVMMATLVVGPFYLAHSLGLNEMMVGLVLAVGPGISMFCGVPAGRLVDRLGAPNMVFAGLAFMSAGALALCFLPHWFGMAGYMAAIAVLTPGYQLFQAANNTTVMTNSDNKQRGVISAMIGLSRNLGFITGASLMGTIFALASSTGDMVTAQPAAVEFGMRVTFGVAGLMVMTALAIAYSRLATTEAMDKSKGQLVTQPPVPDSDA